MPTTRDALALPLIVAVLGCAAGWLALPGPAPAVPAPAPPPARHEWTADELRRSLVSVPELRLGDALSARLRDQLPAEPRPVDSPRSAADPADDFRRLAVEAGRLAAEAEHERALARRRQRADVLAASGAPPVELTGAVHLRGLPFLRGPAARADAGRADALAAHGRALRRLVARPGRRPNPRDLDRPPDTSDGPADRVRRAFRGGRADAVPALAQLLSCEGAPARRVLTDLLAAAPDRPATDALARLAVFDPDPGVRRSAVAALADRPRGDARPVLIAALGHPWPPAADHAADALAALADRAAAADIDRLLAGPVPRPGRELVKVNHLRNCRLCHPPGAAIDDPVAGPVPLPGRPLPAVYYDDPADGDGFVRADVTYLRQDFSRFEPVADAYPWPTWQRFDYLVRSVPARAGNAEPPGGSPQRRAAERARAALAAGGTP